VDFPRQAYAEAVAEETAIRNLAFLDVSEDVVGIAVRPMTLRDVIVLDGIGSPFMCGGIPSPQDVVTFLWLQSPTFKPTKFAAWKFAKSCRGMDFLKTVASVKDYVDEAFMDSPGGSAKAAESYYSFAASLVDVFGHEYGWSEAQVMACPLKRLFQYLNAIRQRNDSKAIMFNPKSGLVRREFLIAANKQN